MKDVVYIMNLDEYSDIGTHWIALHALNNNFTYLDSFGVQHIPKEIKKFVERSLINKSNIMSSSITTNNNRIQEYDSVMCGYICIQFIDFILNGESLTDFTNLFSPNNSKINDNIVLSYFING